MKNKPLSEIEYETLWMAIRYAMGRQTIASASLPDMIIKHYGKRLSNYQKGLIVHDLENHLNVSHFGNPEIDHKHWMKLLNFCKDGK